MAYNLKTLTEKEERITGGHRMCAGCGAPIVVRTVLRALKPEDHAVIGVATGCLEVSTCLYPYTAWKDSFIHSAFENAAATVSGAEAAYRALAKVGKVKGTTKFIAFGGDGGTYDIGFQALSGAMERGHDMVYVCYDNEAYMNTGIQRSSSTPKYADTTTSPAGSEIPGKVQFKKDLTMIMAAHNIPYVAQTAPFRNLKDLYEKAEKALYTPGPAFLNVLAPCPRGWRYNTPQLMEIVRLAIETCVWPLYEVIEGKFILNYKPKNKLPVVEYLKPQGRFRHLFTKENEGLLDEIQKEVDRRWNRLLELCGEA
ncbi:thiamine pyrophosphate-dependent enzyme [Caldicoprobacter faecalis]|uniref:Pyruvate ferredoxin oxidoreductase beta subunit n=1 Tax=Caldicoprobacter faecalis TaxID=937334 RepID=A0A1I5SWN7_9FIRM|nr:thiamine pyrophosphate-dependent enzyme [Caldicoprobacter faecalis]PZN10579.1 MAG: pyruvate ferredoxin oxidoreductase [Caldicoprobacter oshimai]SFP75153.1 pyruvate ferredoxin oxidoreductase beta subunit [Caldicoprobacter faecalis]